MNRSPLRYPGGKSRITNFVAKVIRDNNITGGCYVEPFAGGAGVALNLLFDGIVDRIFINDKDRSIYAFWDAVVNHTERFICRLESINVTIEEWKKQREIQLNKENADLFDLGFSTFFLNRTNRSGIIMAGVIGGFSQTGKWKIDVRFNKESLIAKIKNIGKYRKKIHIFNLDAINFLDDVVSALDVRNTLIYLDPPYYVKGAQLYMNSFKHEDHVKIFNKLSKLQHYWLVSYDDQKEIREIYQRDSISYLLRYTVGPKYHGSEVMFASDNLILDFASNPLDVKKAI